MMKRIQNQLKMAIIKKCILLSVTLLIFTSMNVQSSNNSNQSLDPRQQSIFAIAALTAQGNVAELATALRTGLDAGLTTNEIKEVRVQLYAYCGFPRSLNRISSFMKVVEERKAKGIHDFSGKQATPVNDSLDKY